MRWSVRKQAEWRWFLAPLVITFFALLVVMTGCYKQFNHDPLYEQGLDVPSSSDGDIYIPLVIQNHRTIDPIDPTFYLLGAGRHSLGQVKGFGGRLRRFIPTSWFNSDGCFQIVAHYAGTGDLVFDQFCWRRGEKIDVSLDNIFVPTAAWSHR